MANQLKKNNEKPTITGCLVSFVLKKSASIKNQNPKNVISIVGIKIFTYKGASAQPPSYEYWSSTPVTPAPIIAMNATVYQ